MAEDTNNNPHQEGGTDNGALHVINSPCYLFNEVVKSILKCLGFDSSSSSSDASKPTGGNPSDPPGDPPSDPAPEALAGRAGRTPPRPVVSGGRDPQTHSLPTTSIQSKDLPEAIAKHGRTPPRPGVSGGKDPQTHNRFSYDRIK